MPSETGHVKNTVVSRIITDHELPVGRKDSLADPAGPDRQITEPGLKGTDIPGELLQHGGIFTIVSRFGGSLVTTTKQQTAGFRTKV